MRRREPEEPLTISGATVAAYLEQRGMRGMASFVRHLDDRAANQNRREMLLEEKLNAVLKRLHHYEPPADTRQADFRPPPEASD